MKTAKEWLQKIQDWDDMHDRARDIRLMSRLIRDIQVDAHAEGRREGLLEAAKVADDAEARYEGGDDAWIAARIAVSIRELAEAEKGGGG